MRRIGRALVWLRRVNHCRGFGVQSPWAYRFIRYVVNEHNPYYAYERMNDQLPGLDEQTRKMCRLYFRLANFMQAQRIFSYCSPTTAYAAYMNEGCKKTSVVEIGEDDVESFETTCADNQSVEFLRISPQGNYQTLYEKALPYMDSKSMMVVEDIHKKQETKEFWKSVVNDERTGVTFDLYYCGIIFFDKKRYKENYIVNF